MKRQSILFALLVGMIVISSNVYSDPVFNDLNACWKPYVGLDAQIRLINYKHNFGDGIIERNYPEGDAFLGVMFSDYFGLEIGREESKRQSLTTDQDAGEIIFGSPIGDSTISATSRTAAKIRGWYFMMSGFLPIKCFSFLCDDSVKLVGSIGLSEFTYRCKHEFLVLDDESQEGVVTNFEKRQLVPRLSIGLLHMVTKSTGIRALVSWEDISKISVKGSDVVEELIKPIIRPKNGFIYGVGILTYF